MSHEVISFTWHNWKATVTSTGLLLTGDILLRIAASLSCVAFIMFSTPFAEILQVLRKMRLPALVLEIMQIMYRFLFILSETAANMYLAQRARGGQAGFRNRLKDTATLIVQMFMKTMHQCRSLTSGLVARGFADDLQLAPYQAVSVPRRYWLEGAAGFLLLLLLEIGLRLQGRSL